NVDPESASAARMSDHGRPRVQTADKAEEAARRLRAIRHGNDLGWLTQAEPESQSTGRKTAVEPRREAGERVRLITAHDLTDVARGPRKELANRVAVRAAVLARHANGQLSSSPPWLDATRIGRRRELTR